MLKKNNLFLINFLNYSISLIPLSLILGNLVTNFNIFLIILIGLLVYGKEIFITPFEDKKFFFLISSFFIFLIITTNVNNYKFLEINNIYKINNFKSLFYLRYLLLSFVLLKLIEDKKLNLKIFYVVSASLSLLLAIDIIFQYCTGKDLIGYEIYLERPAGFFGSENIAGGYLQKFSLFFLIIGYYYLSLKKFKNKIFFTSAIFFFLVILITNNRMSLLIFFISILILTYIIFNKKYFNYLFILILILFSFFVNKNLYLKQNYKRFYENVSQILIVAPQLFLNKTPTQEIKISNTYLPIFNGGVQLIKDKPFFGYGIKSFILNCKWEKKDNIPITACQMHPHNYYIEILLNSGLIGFAFIFTIIIKCLLSYWNFLKINKNKFHNIILSSPFFLIFLFEIFPIRSTGSFFTTNNAIVFFLIVPIIYYINKINFSSIKI